MERTLTRLLLFFSLGLLAACGEDPTPTPIPVPTNFPTLTPDATGTAAALITPPLAPTATFEALETYAFNDYGFVLGLPSNWIVGEALQTPLGVQFQVGPEPLGPGPFTSTILIDTAAARSADELAQQLACGGDCPDAVQLGAVSLGEQPAQRAIINPDSPTPLEWYFVEHAGQLIAFTLHDPATLVTRADVLAGIAFVGLAAAAPSATTTITPTLTTTLTPTPAPPTATPTPGQDDIPLDAVFGFLEGFAFDPTGQRSILYLSQARRAEVGDPESTDDMMDLDWNISTFQTSYIETIINRVYFAVTLNFRSGRTETRILVIIWEDGEWVVDGVEFPEPVSPTPTSVSEPTPTPTLINTP